MASPSPSSFDLMNCLFSYQRVMSTKPRNIYSWNKRHGNRGEGEGRGRVHRKKAGYCEELLALIPGDTGLDLQPKLLGSPPSSLGDHPPPSHSTQFQALPCSRLTDPATEGCQEPKITAMIHLTVNCLNIFFLSEILLKSLLFSLF